MNIYTSSSVILFLTTSLAFVSYAFNLVSSRFLFIKGMLIYLVCYGISSFIGDMSFLDSVTSIEAALDYQGILIHGFLSYLLFAGALQIHMKTFFDKLPEILSLALISTSLATFLTAFCLYTVSMYTATPLSLIACLLFSACVSPTDPIAVIALLRNVKLPPSIETKIAGESLLNDGIGIVFFTTFLHLASSSSPNLYTAFILFFKEALGGLFSGYMITLAWVQLIGLVGAKTSSSKIDIYWSLSLVNLVYLLGCMLGVSVPLACVSAGLTASYKLSSFSKQRYTNLLNFWEVIDDILNTIIFFLTGTLIFRVMVLHHMLSTIVLSVVITCIMRVVSVYLPLRCMLFWRYQYKNLVSVVSLSGLKGGLSLALALSIPNDLPGHELIFGMTFAVVAFTLVIQSSVVTSYAQYLNDHGKL